MQAKNVLYAAVGAPVVAARKVTDVVGDIRVKFNEETADYTKVASKAFDSWASEGQKIVARVSDNKTVEEITSKVDLDQVQEQVGKLRTQLEDMLATWRASFRPTQAGEKAASEVAPAAEKPAAKTTAAKKPAARKPAAKKPAAKTSATKASAAKTTAAKTSSAKTTADKSAKAS